jgi:ferredoxin-NADP reductase
LCVTKVVRETANVSSIYLTAQDGIALPVAQAGLYITLRVAGAGQPAPVRSYSLSSAPGAAVYRISVKVEANGAVSPYLNHALRAGATLEVAAPRGDFVLDDGSEPVLLISAGIGVTPVLSMLHQLAKARSEREVWWIYSARRPPEYPLAAEVSDLLQSLPHTREHLFFTRATLGELHRQHAVAGHVTKATLAGLGLPARAQAYVCGPPRYMADVHDALGAAGIEAARIHTELFAALPSTNPGVVGHAVRAPHQPPGPPGTGPLITFARSGISTPFAASSVSLLELADACDVPTRWSCRTGVCHTCITALLSGAVSYSPDPLEAPSDGQVLICCSRPRSDIVLDM